MSQSSTTTDRPKQQYQIQVLNRNQSFLCDAGKSVLTAMEQVNANCINVGCRGGGCGLCKIGILEGDYQTQKMSKSHIAAKDLSEGFSLSCRTFPSSDMTIESDHFQLNPVATNHPDTAPEIPNNQANKKDNAEDK